MTHKICLHCFRPVCLDDFPISKARKDRRNSSCKECCALFTRQWRKTNPLAAKKSERLYKLRNAENVKAAHKAYWENNQERRREIINKAAKKYKDANRDKLKEYRKRYASTPEGHLKIQIRGARRRAAELQRTPEWLTKTDLLQIEKYYKLSELRTKETGVRHHVDHIVPLCGKNFSGLHVPWNLQVITAQENQTKWNKLNPSMLLAEAGKV